MIAAISKFVILNADAGAARQTFIKNYVIISIRAVDKRRFRAKERNGRHTRMHRQMEWAAIVGYKQIQKAEQISKLR